MSDERLPPETIAWSFIDHHQAPSHWHGALMDLIIRARKDGGGGAPPSRQPDFRTEVFQAAERANARYGQWMPQRWLEIFIGEMMKEPE